MKELPLEFTGRGEVKGFTFKQIHASCKAYLYEINGKHYEVFRRKINTRFGNVSYPKSRDFGRWAWTYNSRELAEKKFNELNQ